METRLVAAAAWGGRGGVWAAGGRESDAGQGARNLDALEPRALARHSAGVEAAVQVR